MALETPPCQGFLDDPSPSSSLTVAVVSLKSVSILAPQVPWLPACGPHWLDAVAIATAFLEL